MNVHFITANGDELHLQMPFHDIAKAIGADALDTVNLRDGRVMLVDDNGYETQCVEHAPGHFELKPVAARKPVNAKATAMYLRLCRPGTTHQIVGDVAIVVDAECAA